MGRNFEWISIPLGLLIVGFIITNCNGELTPPYFNLATGRKIYASATCGVGTDGPELYCKLVGANTEHDQTNSQVIQGQVCDYCDPTNPEKHHPPENAIDGTTAWWQSPPLSRGNKYNEVNLTIDFGQEFHVAYLFIRMGNSPRPGLWTLEKSSDYGKSWTPWQHFSDTESDCDPYFGKESINPITRDDDVICTTDYSKIVPLEDGEIPVMLLNNRPSANNYFNSSALQEWTRATNIRIRLLRTKNLLGHLMSVARQDPTVTRRYFYSIKDISIGGRCMCNGHADTCDVLDPKSPVRILACRCQHRTCGIQCNECCPGFEQKKWRQNTNARPFQCEPCNCHGHSNTCIYDEDIDLKGLSMDIHGVYEGGGICQNCLHHTEGINCNKCESKYYRPRGKKWDDSDVCKPCDCDHFFSTGNCEEETGRCECRKEFQPPNCDTCAYGYFGHPQCRECDCNLNGTDGYHCEAIDGTCPCKVNFGGAHCKQCAPGYFSYPECKRCECNRIGSINNLCDLESGQCKCLGNFGGDNCERCKHGNFEYPQCKYCDCDVQGTKLEICNKEDGKCMCKDGYGGPRCDQCLPGYYNYPDCLPCNCSATGSTASTCDTTGKCNCLSNFAGRQCTLCSAGYFKYPDCLPCNCDVHGAEGLSCNSEGQCLCMQNVDGKVCDKCKEGFYNFPACEECNCDPAGVIARFAGCGSVPAGELCQCKERVTGRICNQCKSLFWNLNVSNPDGCEDCECFSDGTIAELDTCDSKTGQCVCKPYVQDRQCRECKDGTFDLDGGSLFGCKDCSCDIGGSRYSTCDKLNGQCNCHPRISGRTCTQPLTTHYFPTLHQFQYEYEDGLTPSGALVRYQYVDEPFPGFSGKGYAMFDVIQSEVINEVQVFKSSVYRMVIRYVNPTNDNVTATILIQSDNPSEADQDAKVLLRATKTPQFVTVSGAKGDKPSPIVLDPGRYKISTKTKKLVLLDYFVLLPAAYYEASILTRRIENPCELGNMELCRHYKYPSVKYFNPATEPFITEGDHALKAREFYDDPEHLRIISHSGSIPVISDTQRSLKYSVEIPHTGRYVIVIDYITERTSPNTYFVKLRIENGGNEAGGSESGTATLYPCLYSMACRQPIVDEDYREKAFFIDVTDLGPVEVYHDHDDFGQAAIISVTAIPIERWSIDYINPSPVCVIHQGECSTPKFRSVPDSKKIELETEHEDRITLKKPPYAALDENVKLIMLDKQNSTIHITSQVSEPGRYVILVKYYQPNHPKYNVFYSLEAGKQYYDGKFDVNHCPTSSGCRGLIRPQDGNWWFDIKDDFKFTITNNHPEGVWLDYLLVVPVDQFNEDLLVEETFDQTKEFIRTCGQDHFYIPLDSSDFCKKAVFSLTADYNNGALPCSCNYDGSTSFECDPYGGQCQCKPNIIGRHCDACRTGFYGFPECKPCDCPITALCEKSTGECICPPHVTGEKCDQCKAYTYGFHQIIGCEECNCHVMGVEQGNLQCDLYNGSCACRKNIEGRACDECSNGFFNFPNCNECSCNTDGTEFEVCGKNDGICYCKKNVFGENCEFCVDGTYNLQASNPEGCTKCFCFGKASRCESAYLKVFNVSLLRNVSLNNVYIRDNVIDIEQWELSADEIMVNDTALKADFSLRSTINDLVYFGVIDYLANQNNHLTSYGGHLAYTLYYTTGLFGNAKIAPDVILYGKNHILIHQNYKQPANAQTFKGTVEMIESNFQTHDGKVVSRADFMMVLRDLRAIYIRANYWEQTIISILSDVYLTLADHDADYDSYQELPVEKCHCPPGYSGLSCEDCATGYYRDPDGSYGGYCIQCECNGHADTCDCHTGICDNCLHSTYGDHCEMCIEGYYGNATYGTPHDCMICACPLPIDSNNFAFGCEISDAGSEIFCQCKPGYIGERCQSCAPGFYGRPEEAGDFCKPCECSGNINPNDPSSCDTITGECLNCLNNTFGKACNLCAPGFYGDAIKLKDCKSCDCDEMGTLECDPFVGSCVCHENVIGERCDSCKVDHYGFDSGYGCKECNCGVASNNTQCDGHTGECACMPGANGRQCDRCAVDYWKYTAQGCTPCLCNKGYSRGFGCNPATGQCECLPGVIGEKCDNCPHRWVLLKDEGCQECDSCHHALLDVTDRLHNDIDPVVNEFQSVALAFFTTQKLNYFDNMADMITPEVQALDPKGVNLNPARNIVEDLENETKALAKKISHIDQNGVESNLRAQALLANATNVLKESQLVNLKTHNAIRDVDALAKSFDADTSTKFADALNDAEHILQKINNTEIDLEPSNEVLDRATELLFSIDQLIAPINEQNKTVAILKSEIATFSDKMEDLNDWSLAAIKKASEVEDLNALNKLSFVNSQFDTVADQYKEANKNIEDSDKYLINGDLTVREIEKNLKVLAGILDELKDMNVHVENMTIVGEVNYKEAGAVVTKANENAEDLAQRANDLSNHYASITANSKDAIKATKVYENIVQAVGAAYENAKDAKFAAGNATQLCNGIGDRAGHSQAVASNLLQDAQSSLNKVQTELEPRLNKSSKAVQSISDINENTEKKLKEINLTLEQLPSHSEHKTWKDSRDAANDALDDSNAALTMLLPITKQTPKDLVTAQNVSTDIDKTNKDISEVSNQVARISEGVSKLSNLADTIQESQKHTETSGQEIGKQIDNLKRQIELAREVANNIKVGVKFSPSTVLELKTPETLSQLATKSNVSAFFNTEKPDGFLLYLGNDNKTSPGRNTDFMALEIVNGYPVLTIDLGNGPERITNEQYVADGKWYQAIVDRTGNIAKLIIRSEIENGKVMTKVTSKSLPGSHKVFNVDKNSRIFIGGYPPDFIPHEDIAQSSFEGEIEELKIGDEEVGLWNFVDGQDNKRGAKARNSLLTQETPSTGYRFNGNGYVALDSRPYDFKLRTSVHFKFKASKDSKDGLMFYAGNLKHHFISVELLNGAVVFKYKLGQHMVAIAEEMIFNDDVWHRVEAGRDGRKGLLKVDGKFVYQQETPPNTEENLQISQEIYFGGFPTKLNHSELTKRNFDGCIDDVIISGINVDLKQHYEAIGVRSGCPEKFSSSLSYRPHEFGYLKSDINTIDSNNNFHINLKFRSRQSDGIIFYATDKEQLSTIGLTIDKGNLVLRSMRNDFIVSDTKYNDGEWHVVTALHDNARLQLTVDDTENRVFVTNPLPLTIEDGEIYFGGLPNNFGPVKGALSNLAYFVGCINDVTLNGVIFNFASSTDRVSGSIDDCPADILDYDVSSVQHYFPGDVVEETFKTESRGPSEENELGVIEPDTTLPPFVFMDTTQIPQSTTTTATTTTTTPPPPPTAPSTKRTTTAKPPDEQFCKLPIDPDYDVTFNESGYRFLGKRDTRVEINSLPVKLKKHYDISLEFRTDFPSGLLFYTHDEKHVNFVAVYIHNGTIYHQFRFGRSTANLSTNGQYHDGQWHKVEFIRNQQKAVLIVDSDGERKEIEVEGSKIFNIEFPISIGGLSHQNKNEEELFLNTELKSGDFFHGCIRSIMFNGRHLETMPSTIGVVPCSDQIEDGVFFGKDAEFVKLFDKFNVGNEMTIIFDFKPRTQNGMLFSVHTKNRHMILELVDNTLFFVVKTDERNRIEANYTLSNNESFCDGRWRTVHAVKSKFVITLTVDSISSQPAYGIVTASNMVTTRPLFMGGHPALQRMDGFKTKKMFQGCIRRINIRSKPVTVRKEMVRGGTWLGICPLN